MTLTCPNDAMADPSSLEVRQHGTSLPFVSMSTTAQASPGTAAARWSGSVWVSLAFGRLGSASDSGASHAAAAASLAFAISSS